MNAARMRRRWWGASLAACALLSGVCAPAAAAKQSPTPQPPAQHALPPAPLPVPEAPPPAKLPDQPASPPAPACADPAHLFEADDIFAASTEVLRIDLPTALRLADAGNPTINLARARVAAAYARVRQVQLLWLPDLQLTPSYLRHDGEIQNAAGVVFNTNKRSVFGTGRAVLSVDTGEVLFAPLIARRLAEAQAANSRAVNNNLQLDVAAAYLDLLQAYGQLAVNADLLNRDREVLPLTHEPTAP